jgi:hypothetical protein
MTRTIRCTEARRTLDFDVDQSCDFVARAQTEDAVLAEIVGPANGRPLERGLAISA